MTRKSIALTLLAACMLMCSSITPITSEAFTPQPRTKTEARQDLPEGLYTRTNQNVPSTTIGDLKISILYDNTIFDPRLKADAGFATLIEYKGHSLMFDTGARGSILLHNMQILGMDPRSIETIVLSHEHKDHTGGLSALLNNGNRPTVYLPSTFSSGFKKSISDKTKLVEVTDALAIFPSVYTTRPIGSIIEQALVMDTQDGSVVITGCAHPGIVRIVREAQRVVPGNISLLVGGFHLLHASQSRLQDIIDKLKHIGVIRILPAHCTGEEGIALFKTEYGKNCMGGGVGRKITSSVMKDS